MYDPMLIALPSKVDAELVKRDFLVRHASDGSESVVEPPKVQTDVRGARAIAILGKLTVFVLANAQSPYPSIHSPLRLRPRAAWVEALATRLRRRRVKEGLLRFCSVVYIRVHAILTITVIVTYSHS